MGDIASNNVDISFPCTAVPADPRLARLLGLYPQRQEGLLMQRLKVPGGALSAEQWRRLAAIARRHTPDTPLHLTTRQDVELHDLPAEAIPAVQRELADAGLTTVGACGDTLRNITVCPCSGIAGPDLAPLAQRIRAELEAVSGICALPRKFKIALACSDGCGQPWINDLAFVAAQRDGRWGLAAIGAGSLGPKPETGISLSEWLPAGDAVPLALAAVKLFAEHGDRASRGRARLRHVRQRLGNEAFVTMLGEAFERTKAERDWPHISLEQPASLRSARLTLTFPNGDVAPAAAGALAAVADQEATVRVANHHRVELFASSREQLDKIAAEHEQLRQPARPQASIVACPGTRWCSRGLTDTNAAADAIRGAAGDVPAGAVVGVSGCPNGCAHSRVADIGLVGRLVRDGGQTREAYDIYARGGMGRTSRLAELAASAVPADDIAAHVARIAANLSGGNGAKERP